ncbi:MAG: lipoprotein-releasing ABC transporter permease subunit [Pseudomonadota bacterium]
MNIPVWVGTRYATTGSVNRYMSLVSWISLLGMTLGVIALIVVVSVMNGFDRELKQRILGVVPHVVVEGDVDPGQLVHPLVQEIVPFSQAQGMVVKGGESRLVGVFGIDPEGEADRLGSHLVAGTLPGFGENKQGQVVLGRSLGLQLGLTQGDPVTLVIPVPTASGRSIKPRLMRGQVQGFFRVGSELDYGLVLVSQTDLNRLTGQQGGYRLTVSDVLSAPSVTRALESRLETRVYDWSGEYGDFFQTVRMEKLMMFLLLTLIVAIAAFNIVSGLSMMVRAKRSDIAILRTLGLPTGAVMRIFIFQGSVVGTIGTILGALLGIPLAYHIPEVVSWFESIVGARMLEGTFFARIPTDVRWADILLIILVAMGISLIATLYPAFRAAQLHPAAILRSD